MNYTDQTTDDIRLFLVEGDFGKEQFNVLEENTIKWRNLDVNYGILGESHFVNVSNGTDLFTEICACTSATFDTAKSTVHVSDFVSNILNLPIIQTWKEYTYAFNYICIEYSRGERGVSDLRSVKANEDIHSLAYTFPSKNIFHKKPVTEVYLKKTEDSLFIRTVHTYPNDKLAVFTNSALRLTK